MWIGTVMGEVQRPHLFLCSLGKARQGTARQGTASHTRQVVDACVVYSVAVLMCMASQCSSNDPTTLVQYLEQLLIIPQQTGRWACAWQ
jgi:hypothetical protein